MPAPAQAHARSAPTSTCLGRSRCRCLRRAQLRLGLRARLLHAAHGSRVCTAPACAANSSFGRAARCHRQRRKSWSGRRRLGRVRARRRRRRAAAGGRVFAARVGLRAHIVQELTPRAIPVASRPDGSAAAARAHGTDALRPAPMLTGMPCRQRRSGMARRHWCCARQPPAARRDHRRAARSASA